MQPISQADLPWADHRRHSNSRGDSATPSTTRSPASFRRACAWKKSAMSCSTSARARSEEHTSELQSLMRISYAVFCLKKKKHTTEKLQITVLRTDYHETDETHQITHKNTQHK